MSASSTPPLTQQPTLFVPHGAPTFALNPGVAGKTMEQFAQSIHTPRAIIVISPHWDTPVPTVGFSPRLETIHDFWGFPEALYQIHYPATGCPEASQEVFDALLNAGFQTRRDDTRGLDHGAWVPLRIMFPEAAIPVIPVSVQSSGGPQQALAIGQALAPLSKRGFLILGSGSMTHNLRDYQRAYLSGGQTPTYVRQFADWMTERLYSKDIEALLEYRALAPSSIQAHPSEEHLLPLFVALGASAAESTVNRFHAGIDDFVIAMDAFAFLPPAQ